MNRKLIVTLLRKNIEELNMITDGFMEMENYPMAIIQLAKRKTNDIQSLIEQLSDIKPQETTTDNITNTILAKTETTIKPSEETTETPEKPVILQNEPEKEKPQEQIITIQEPELTTQNAIDSAIDDKTIEVIAEKEEEFTLIETEDETEIIIESKEVKEITEIKNNHEIRTTTDETKKTTIADRIIQPTVSRNETMSKIDHSISATIANKKITDIKQAISIGDRFRFQRELFKGNGEDMNKTLSYINQLATLEEAISFLQSKYGWDLEAEATEDFYQIIKRKFL